MRVLLPSLAIALMGCSTPASDAPPAASAESAEPAPTAAAKPPAEPPILKVGAEAPEVEGEAPDGTTIKLSQVRGKPAVVYFYPKDDTPGCTVEASGFRDAYDRYTAAGVAIFGVSRDDAESHRAFREKHELPFPLVADTDGAVQKAYGVPSLRGTVASRVTFLVDREGRIAHVFEQVDPAVHSDEVLAKLAAL